MGVCAIMLCSLARVFHRFLFLSDQTHSASVHLHRRHLHRTQRHLRQIWLCQRAQLQCQAHAQHVSQHLEWLVGVLLRGWRCIDISYLKNALLDGVVFATAVECNEVERACNVPGGAAA